MCWLFSIDTVESITPDKVRGLRDLLNSSAMDIMYYNSPLYRDEVRASDPAAKPKLLAAPLLDPSLSTVPCRLPRASRRS